MYSHNWKCLSNHRSGSEPWTFWMTTIVVRRHSDEPVWLTCLFPSLHDTHQIPKARYMTLPEMIPFNYYVTLSLLRVWCYYSLPVFKHPMIFTYHNLVCANLSIDAFPLEWIQVVSPYNLEVWFQVLNYYDHIHLWGHPAIAVLITQLRSWYLTTPKLPLLYIQS